MSLTNMISRSLQASVAPPHGFAIPHHVQLAVAKAIRGNSESAVVSNFRSITPRVYNAPRGEDFAEYLREVLVVFGKATLEQANKMVNQKSLKVFAEGLTNSEVDREHNYEVYEKIGDRYVNMTIVEMLVEKYSSLQCRNMHSAVSEIENNLKSSSVMSGWAEKMGLLPWMSSTLLFRVTKTDKLLTDGLEAFIQCVRFSAERYTNARGALEIPRNIIAHFMYGEVDIVLRPLEYRPPRTIVENTWVAKKRGTTKEMKETKNNETTVRVFFYPKRGGGPILMGEATDRLSQTATAKAYYAAGHKMVADKMIPESEITELTHNIEEDPCTRIWYYSDGP